MLGLDMLDVMIGMVTVYLSFGIACTAFVEAISSLMGLRSKDLQNGIKEYFKGSIIDKDGQKRDFADAFFANPLVQTLSKGKKGRPSYIPTELIGQVVNSLLNYAEDAQDLKEKLESLPGEKTGDNRIKDLLLIFYEQAKGDVEAFREKVENHYDASMERVSGWFKRKTQYIAIGASTVLVVFANVDSVEMARTLALNPEVRAELVMSAEKILKDRQENEDKIERKVAPGNLDVAKKKTKKAKEIYEKTVYSLENAGLNFGWESQSNRAGGCFSKIAGLLISIFAISLGAPFWFNVLQRFIQIRGAGSAPKQKPKQA